MPGLDEIYRSNAPATDPSVLQVLCPMIGSLKCVPRFLSFIGRKCLVDGIGVLGEWVYHIILYLLYRNEFAYSP